VKAIFTNKIIRKVILPSILFTMSLCQNVYALDGESGLNTGEGLNSVAKISSHNDVIMEKLEMSEPAEDVFEPQPIGLTGSDAVKAVKRDPFAVTDRLKQAAAKGTNMLFKPKSFQKNGNIPPMHLRGLIRSDSGGLVALLEINDAIHIVRDGDTVGLYNEGSNSVLRIRKINRLNVVVEAGTLGQLIIVR
jgi:Tfp pilus assembly protein PilP